MAMEPTKLKPPLPKRRVPTKLKKEIIMKLSEKIGDVLFEIEAQKDREMVEVIMRESDGGRISGIENFFPYEIQRIAKFFETAATEIKKLTALSCIFLFILVVPAQAAINDQMAIRAILGEARGEGFQGMYAVACAIRNRGHLAGVYGKDAVMLHLTEKVRQEARKAWISSGSGIDITRGATHWENVEAFGTPVWARNMKKIIKINHHTFFKDI